MAAKCPQNRGCIALLHSHGNSLHEVLICVGLISCLLHPPPQVPENSPAASGPNTPHVSTATGTNRNEASRWLYSSLLVSSALAVTAPAPLTTTLTCEKAKVSQDVASHTNKRPLDHGMMVTPFGLLPSDLKRPVSSSRDVTFAETNALSMMSFSSPCHECLPWLHLQLRPWVAY